MFYFSMSDKTSLKEFSKGEEMLASTFFTRKNIDTVNQLRILLTSNMNLHSHSLFHHLPPEVATSHCLMAGSATCRLGDKY